MHKQTSTRTTTAPSSTDSNRDARAASRAKQPRYSPPEDPAPGSNLAVITEVEEPRELQVDDAFILGDPDIYFIADPPGVGPGELPELGKEILSVMASSFRDGGTVESDMECKGDEMSKVFNLDAISGSESEFESDTMQKWHHRNAVTEPAMPIKLAMAVLRRPVPGKFVGSKGKARAMSELTMPSSGWADSSSQIYNPDFYVFKITCGVDRISSSGSKSQVPFQVSSTINYEDLVEIVSDKLRCNKKYIKLQYRLKIGGKIQGGFTSLQSESEYTMFIDTMRPLIVPPCLSNGKMSSKVMRPVIVTFEDTASDHSDKEVVVQAPAPAASGSKKMVCLID
ncbi:hypothetical protein J3R83DRAFT_2321 [Lanmaoa asiatica]|nr:hypothetical protein J3R83DRAFT_2321 [Lanmaoa asiatica]